MYLSIEKVENGFVLSINTPVADEVLGPGAEERKQFVFTTPSKLVSKIRATIGVPKAPRQKKAKPVEPVITVG